MTQFSIAVITATPPAFNAGMALCEATAQSFIRRHGLSGSTRFFRLVHLDERLAHVDATRRNTILARADLGNAYELFETVDQLEGCIPLYWGDFLHMNIYLRTIAASVRSPRLGDRAARALFLLEGGSIALVRRAISFGTSLLFNSTSDYIDPVYGPLLNRFMADAAHIQMRDAISAAVVSTSRPQHEDCFGVDAAQLISSVDCAADAVGDLHVEGSGEARAAACVFFARGSHRTDVLQTFVTEMAAALGTDLQWLPWGDDIAFPFQNRVDETLGIPQPPGAHEMSLADLLQRVRAARVVITDTYHLAVASWAVGTPAIMVPGGFFTAERTGKSLDVLSRHDKRKVFYAQDGLMDLFVQDSALEDATSRHVIVQRLKGMIAGDDLRSWYRQRLASRCNRSEARLKEAIATQLSGLPS